MAANIGNNPSLHSIVGHNSCQSQSMSSQMSRSQELHYVEALKKHQMTRLDHIRNETTKLRLYLEGLKSDVTILEGQRLRDRNEDSEWAQKVTKLREENRALRIECHCLSMEVDLYASGQMPLGVTDENFYNYVPPGPRGPLLRNAGPPPTPRMPPSGHPPYPVQQMPRPPQPPTYEESLFYPPPRFRSVSASNSDILRQVPPAPRPVWLSPTVQQSMNSVSPLAGHSFQRPPQLPPRPNSASPRTPVPGTSASSSPLMGAQSPHPHNEEGQKWMCEKCTFENHSALINCEICEMPRSKYLGISLNTTHYYPNPIPSVQTVAPHNSTDCYCHSCRQ